VSLNPSSEWQQYAALAAILLLSALIYGLYIWRSHRIAEDKPARWNEAAPRHFPIGSIGGKPAPRLDDEALNHLADSMGYFESEEGGRNLNVLASIRATMQNGGTPALAFFNRKQIRSLLVLEDVFAEAATWNPMARELALGIAQRGVPVIYGRFQGSPEQFKTEDGTFHRLDDLEDQRRGFLLLIFTDGKGLCRQESAFVLEALAHWPMVAWMDLREPRFWDETATLPTQYSILIYPATREGLLLVAQRFLTEQGYVTDYSDYARHWKGLPEQSGMRLEAYVEQVLGDALLWAQDCAMLQPISAGLIDSLRRIFHPHISSECIERLHALPGTRNNVSGLRFSTEVLKVLRQGFLVRRTDQEQEKVLRFILQEIHKAQPSEPESLAYLAWETIRERVRLELEASDDLSRLAQIAKTPLAGAISASLENYGFPDQSEKIPLRLKPRNPAALQRLARIAEGFSVKKLDAYPVARAHWAVLAILLVAFLSFAGWSVKTALEKQHPDRNWVFDPPPDNVYAQIEELGGSSTPISGTLSQVTSYTLDSTKKYQLTLYDQDYRTSQILSPEANSISKIKIATTNIKKPCLDRSQSSKIGLTIERCPEAVSTVDEPIRYQHTTWRDRWNDEHISKPNRYLLSVGVEIDDNQATSHMEHWRDSLLWTNSLDIIYRIHPAGDKQLHWEKAIDAILADLGPLASQAQLIVWDIRKNRDFDTDHLTSHFSRDQFVKLNSEAEIQELDEYFRHPGISIVSGSDMMRAIYRQGNQDIYLFRPSSRQGAVIVSTDGITASVTVRSLESGKTDTRGITTGELTSLPEGKWELTAVSTVAQPITATIKLNTQAEAINIATHAITVTRKLGIKAGEVRVIQLHLSSVPSPPSDPLPALVEAAKKEGELTVIALPHDWLNYGEVIDKFKQKYPFLQVNELDPNAGSGDEIQAIKANKENRGPQAPDVVDIGFSFYSSALKDGLFQPYKVETWDTIPDDVKDTEGYWYGDYYGVLSFEVNTDIVKNIPRDWSDLLKPEYKGQIALAGDPHASNQAIMAVYAAALANGGSLDNAQPGLDFFKKLNDAGNLLPVIAKSTTIVRGETPITIRWDYLSLADPDQLKNSPSIEIVIPKSGVLAYPYLQAISTYAPHPNAAKLWMEYLYSDDPQLIWLKAYGHPIRYDDLVNNNKIPADMAAKLPPAKSYGDTTFPTIEQYNAAKKTITENWDTIVGLSIK